MAIITISRGSFASGKALAERVDGVRSVRCDAGMGTDWYW